MKKTVLLFCMLCLGLAAEEIVLPKADLKSGKVLMECFANRRSSRNFSSRALPRKVIGEILFAADGINRPDGRKTVPTAMNRQNQTVYAVLADGVYLYNNKKHSLVPVNKGDFRKDCGKQPFHSVAPMVLVYVSDMDAIGITPQEKAMYAGTHAGSASQNVYLYAASRGLSTVVCGMINKDFLHKTLKLKASQQPLYAQPIGFAR